MLEIRKTAVSFDERDLMDVDTETLRVWRSIVLRNLDGSSVNKGRLALG